MRASGFILRFVDVVLILLFGFIAISNLQDSEIPLPESTETDPVAMDTEEIIFVGVLSDGGFLVDDERRMIRGEVTLRSYLREQLVRLGNAPIKVRIRSSHDAPVQYAFAVATMCDELGIKKSLEVELDASM